jgi:hypothetical protein
LTGQPVAARLDAPKPPQHPQPPQHWSYRRPGMWPRSLVARRPEAGVPGSAEVGSQSKLNRHARNQMRPEGHRPGAKCALARQWGWGVGDGGCGRFPFGGAARVW